VKEKIIKIGSDVISCCQKETDAIGHIRTFVLEQKSLFVSINMSQNSFKRESLLELALLIVSSRDSYSADIANYKQEWLDSFEEGTICKRDDFLKERGTWDINVFIPGITDKVKRDCVFYLWRQKGTKKRTGNARKENKELAEELATFDDVFNDIANQMFGVPKSGFKRPRDNAEDEQQLYETGSEEIEFGIEVLKKLSRVLRRKRSHGKGSESAWLQCHCSGQVPDRRYGPAVRYV
jgi:hypothetical protein